MFLGKCLTAILHIIYVAQILIIWVDEQFTIFLEGLYLVLNKFLNLISKLLWCWKILWKDLIIGILNSQIVRQKDGRLEQLLSLDECVEQRLKGLMARKPPPASNGHSNGAASHASKFVFCATYLELPCISHTAQPYSN